MSDADIAALQVEVEHLKDEVHETKEALKETNAALAANNKALSEIATRLAEVKGGWRALALVGTFLVGVFSIVGGFILLIDWLRSLIMSPPTHP